MRSSKSETWQGWEVRKLECWGVGKLESWGAWDPGVLRSSEIPRLASSVSFNVAILGTEEVGDAMEVKAMGIGGLGKSGDCKSRKVRHLESPKFAAWKVESLGS